MTWLASVLVATALVVSEPAPGRTETLVVAVAGLDRARLVAALQLRLPELRVRAAEGDGPPRPGELHLRIDLAADALVLRAALADGRVFERQLTNDVAEPERSAATSITHWLAAIDAGEATPTSAAPPIEAPPPITTPPIEATPPITAPTRTRDRLPAITDPRPTSPPTRPMLTLGPVVGAVALAGVGRPAALSGLLGVAAAAGLELRLPRGPLFTAELRVVDTRAAAYRLTRLRAAVFAGYALVQRRFTLRAQLGVGVEPWWSDGAGTPLLGGALRITPGLRARVGPQLHAQLGLRLELAVSGTRKGAAVLLVDDATPVFRLGGVELGAGIELGLAWDLRR